MEFLSGPTGDREREVNIASLDGAEYVLTYTWNALFEAWYLNIALGDGTALVNGIRVRTRVALFNLHTNTLPLLPQGVLMVLTRSDDVSDPGQFDFETDGRCQLVYFTLEEALRIRARGEAQRPKALTIRKIEDAP